MMRVLTTILITVLTVIFCMCTPLLPTIGDVSAPQHHHVSDYYISHSEEDTGSPNIVTGTLADYRGFDTLWETSVMFVSGLTAVLILKAGREENAAVLKGKKKKKGAE